ncbi:Rhomboid-like protein [gamma proteobacterium HdN1]|nr:Rhomboid-like protein [gamma proteobacterium HdN1]
MPISKRTLQRWLAQEKKHWSTAFVVGLVLIFSLMPESVVQALSLTREGVRAGEWWRIWTSQIVHLNGWHALLNAAGFGIVSLSFRNEVSAWREITVLLISMACVGMGIFWWNPEISWYVGLSGAIYSVLVHHLILGFRQTPLISGVFLLYVIAKVSYEQLFGTQDNLMEQLIEGRVAYDAHFYGAITGALLGGLGLVLRRASRS